MAALKVLIDLNLVTIHIHIQIAADDLELHAPIQACIDIGRIVRFVNPTLQEMPIHQNRPAPIRIRDGVVSISGVVEIGVETRAAFECVVPPSASKLIGRVITCQNIVQVITSPINDSCPR